MKVSRPTFVRVLDAARKKIAEALIKGKAIRTEGGHFEITGVADVIPLQTPMHGRGPRSRFRRGHALQDDQNINLKDPPEKNEDIR